MNAQQTAKVISRSKRVLHLLKRKMKTKEKKSRRRPTTTTTKKKKKKKRGTISTSTVTT